MTDPQRQVCQVLPWLPGASETFIQANAHRMPVPVTIVHGMIPKIGARPVLSQALVPRVVRKVSRAVNGRSWNYEITHAFVKAFERSRAFAVLAEYGPTGVRVVEACRQMRLPLIVHFHGYDASRREVLAEHAEGYKELFKAAAAIVSVSQAMRRKLIDLGAPPAKTHLRPYGVDGEKFGGARPAAAPPKFVAVGRLVEKKAPHLTLLAFAEARRTTPSATLSIIGDGPLLAVCRDLCDGLGIRDAVSFLGTQSHERVQEEMRTARAFVQHSVEADDGDCEGTPVAVLEAGATGLPVIATRHGGICDAVVEGETGWLVNERDVAGMAVMMTRVLESPDMAERMGGAARARILAHYSVADRSQQLWQIIQDAASAGAPPTV